MTQQGDLSTPMLLLYVTKQCVVIVASLLAKSKSAHRFVSLRAYEVFKFCFVCSNVTQLRFIGSEVALDFELRSLPITCHARP